MANKKGTYDIEKRSQGDYAVRKPGSERASAVEPTQEKAIDRAEELNPDAGLSVVYNALLASMITPAAINSLASAVFQAPAASSGK